MPTKRIAIIGLGQRIAHVLLAMEESGWDLDIAGYADPAPVGLPLLKRDIRAYADTASLLADGPFDLTMIGSPNHLHYEHLLASFAAGYPVFAEKPIVRTEDETFALARHLANAPPLYIGLVMRSMPIVREVIARVDSGVLGEIVSLDATEHLPPEHGAYLARNWRRKQEWGGSFLLDKVCHDFDIFGRIAGSRTARVASFGGKRIFEACAGERARGLQRGRRRLERRERRVPLRHGCERSPDGNRRICERRAALVPFQQPCQPSGTPLVHRGHQGHADRRSGAQPADGPARA